MMEKQPPKGKQFVFTGRMLAVLAATFIGMGLAGFGLGHMFGSKDALHDAGFEDADMHSSVPEVPARASENSGEYPPADQIVALLPESAVADNGEPLPGAKPDPAKVMKMMQEESRTPAKTAESSSNTEPAKSASAEPVPAPTAMDQTPKVSAAADQKPSEPASGVKTGTEAVVTTEKSDEKKSSAQTSDIPKETEKKEAAKKPEKSQNTKPEKPKSSKPAVSSSANSEKWTIQVGAFSNAEEARSLTMRLRKQGFAAYFLTVKSGAGTMYKVRAGIYDSRGQAESAAAKVKSSNGLTSMVLRYQ